MTNTDLLLGYFFPFIPHHKKASTPKPKALQFDTDLNPATKLGDKLTVKWSGGIAPYQVEVQADTIAIVDFVNVNTDTSYSYGTAGETAGTYVISVKDSAGTVITSTASKVS